MENPAVLLKNGQMNGMQGAGQNGQIDARAMEAQQQAASIFGSKAGSANVNQSNSNAGGMGGVGNIFAGGGLMPAGMDNTSIFSGMNKGSNYALFSKKDYNYDVPKLTQESIANQKAAEGPKRTNPKPYNIDMTPKANPYEAFRNADMQERSIGETIGDAFASLFGQKKSN